MRFLGIAFLFVSLFSSAALAMPVDVSNPVADFLRRLEEKGVVPIGFWSTLPRDESEVAAVLKQAEQKESSLNSWDRRRLEHYLDEFDPERKKHGTKLHYEDSSFMLHGEVEYFTGGYSVDSITERDNKESDAYAFGSFAPTIEATYGRFTYLTTSAFVGMERSVPARFPVDNYDPQNGLPYNVANMGINNSDQHVSTFDGFRMVGGAGNSNIHLEIGQDWNEWGPGHWQHTTLSDHPYFWDSDSLAADSAVGFYGGGQRPLVYPGSYRRGYEYPGQGPPMPQIRFRVGSDHWDYVKIIAQTMGINDSFSTLFAQRLSAHFGSFRFGASELLAFGRPSIPLTAYLPAVPLLFAEHEGAGETGNAALSADAEWIWTGHGRLYGELYVDDFNGFPLDRWNDKFASVLGASWQDAFGLPSEIHMEYAFVDPWVYEHYENDEQLQNYGSLLGSMLPPNSQGVFASVGFPLPKAIDGLLEWDFRQRDLKSAGSSIFDVHGTSSDIMQFLAKDVETRNQITLSMDWSWKRFVQLKAGAGWLWVETWEGNPVENLSTPSVFGEVTLKY